MSVIKCSNCENDILDSEIVCPYCDCPISETIRKMKADDLQSYSSTVNYDLTVKVPAINPDKVSETIPNFEEKKAQILKDLGIDPQENTDTQENDEIIEETPQNEDYSTDISDPMDNEDTQETFEVSSDEPYEFDIEKDIEAPKDETAPLAKVTPTGEETVKISREELSKTSDLIDHKTKEAKKKASSSNKLILGVTIAGVAVIIILIWALISLISGQNEKPPVENVKPVQSEETKSDADKGFELKSGTLTITDSSVMKDYDSPNETPWFEIRNKIKQVVFGEGIEKIGAHAFEGFKKITSVSIPDSVIKIGESAFTGCLSLREITSMSKAIKEIDDYAFTGCKSLNKIPGYTEEANFEPTIERIGIEAFKSCKAIEEFKLPVYTEIGRDAFYGHGEGFVIVCKTSSEAYDYAIEKGIPTKLSFGDEQSNNEEENTDENKEPQTPPAQQEPPKPNQNKEPDANKPTEQKPQTGTTPAVPNQNSQKSLAELLKELESASSQEEKDRILGEIDKITQ